MLINIHDQAKNQIILHSQKMLRCKSTSVASPVTSKVRQDRTDFRVEKMDGRRKKKLDMAQANSANISKGNGQNEKFCTSELSFQTIS